MCTWITTVVILKTTLSNRKTFPVNTLFKKSVLEIFILVFLLLMIADWTSLERKTEEESINSVSKEEKNISIILCTDA